MRALEDQPASLDYLDEIANQLRRATWFEYSKKRFDLLPLLKVLDWCAREPDGFSVNEARKERVLTALMDSIRLGEFGDLPWPQIAYFRVDGSALGSCALRLSMGQIERLRAEGQAYDPTPYLWAPRTLCRRWLDARGIPLPPWFGVQLEPPGFQAPAAALNAAPAEHLNKFDREQAKALLAAMKLKGGWSIPPTEDVSRDFLLKNFTGVPNDHHRKIRSELWPGQIKRGPKPRAKAAN